MAISALLIAGLGGLMTGAFRAAGMLNPQKTAALEGVLIALERLGAEAQTSSVYASIPIAGDGKGISFGRLQALSSVAKDPYSAEFRLGQVQSFSGGPAYEMQKIEYAFDPSRGALVRRAGQQEKILADRLRAVTFRYAVVGKEGIAWQWTEKTPEAGEGTLAAVRVEIKLDDSSWRFGIPSVEKTFLVVRTHPLYLEAPKP